MLLLDTSFLIEFEDELVNRESGPATAVLAAHRRQAVAISIITLGEFAEGFIDPRALLESALQGCLSRRLGGNDAWIAATALSYEASLVAREKAFERVPRLNYLAF
jgi:predicted nucleic acid-binding protein